jgi:type I restriction enzyme S subunit
MNRTESEPVPAKWQIATLGEICDQHQENVDPSATAENVYVGLEHIEPGNPRLTNWGRPAEVRSGKTRFRPSDILYGKLRPYLDKAVLAERGGICSTDILVFRCPNGAVLPEFLIYALHTREFLEHAVRTTHGVNHPRTSWAALRQFALPVPPVPEQRRIAGVLSTIQRSIEAQNKVIAAARELKRSLMKHLFTYGPVPVTETSRVPLKETDFGPIPAHWKILMLASCAEVQTGIAKGRRLGRDAATIMVPYLRVANVQSGYLDLSEIKHIDLRKPELSRYSLQPGDVLLTEGGDFDKLGRGFLWHGQIQPCVHQNHIFAVRTAPTVLSPEYLAFLLQSRYGRSYFLKVAHRTTHLACINAAKVKALPVPVPPVNEQAQITNGLNDVDQKIASEEKRQAALQALFKSMLHHLMTGKIRVNTL